MFSSGTKALSICIEPVIEEMVSRNLGLQSVELELVSPRIVDGEEESVHGIADYLSACYRMAVQVASTKELKSETGALSATKTGVRFEIGGNSETPVVSTGNYTGLSPGSRWMLQGSSVSSGVFRSSAGRGT